MMLLRFAVLVLTWPVWSHLWAFMLAVALA